MSLDLIPIPLLRTINPPSSDDPEQVRSVLAELVAQWNKTIPVLRQDISRLSLQAVPGEATIRMTPLLTGGAFAISGLTSLPTLLNASSFKDGLVLADGTDRGKVNITFNYLGIGPSLIGSGASVTYTADLAVAGANGLDTGAEAASTWYAVHMIVGPATEVLDQTANNLQPPVRREGSKVAALLSTSSTAPTLPPGFARFRRVGWVRNNSGSDLLRFYATGNFIWWNENPSAAPLLVLNAGTATAWTGVSCSGVVPSTSRMVFLGLAVDKTVGAGTTRMSLRPTGSNWVEGTPTRPIANSNQSLNGEDGGAAVMILNSSQSLDYQVEANNSGYIGVQGYYDAV